MYRFLLRSLINVVSAALVMGVLLGGGLLLRLAWGPISLDPLAPTIAREVNAGLPSDAGGWGVDVGGAELRFEKETARLRLLLRDVAVRSDASGEEKIAARAPSLAFKVDPWRALNGELSVSGVELIGARLLVRRTPEGRFRFAVLEADAAQRAANDAREDAGPEEADVDVAAELSKILTALDDGRPEETALEAFRELVVSKLDFAYEDAVSGLAWRSRDATLVFERQEDALAVRLDATIQQIGAMIDARQTQAFGAADLLAGNGEPTRLSIAASNRFGDKAVDVVVDFANASPALAAYQDLRLATLAAIRAPLEGRLRGRVDMETGAVLGASASVTLGAGHVERPDAPPLAFDRLDLATAYDAETERVTVENARLRAPGLSLDAHASLALSRDAEGRLERIRGWTTIDQGEISREDLVVEPVTIASGRARLGVAFERPGDLSGPATAQLDSLRLDLERARLSGELTAFLDDLTLWRGTATLEAESFAAPDLARLWPAGAAPGAQLWIAENIKSGRIEDVKAVARFERERGGDLDVNGLDVAFRFHDLESTYLDDMSAISGGYGGATLDLQRFALDVEAGQVDLGEAGVLDLAGSRFEIPDINADPTPSEIEIHAAGSARALLTLIDEQPLGFISRLGLAPASVDGTVRSTTVLSLPLLRDLPLEDVVADGTATLKAFALRPPGMEARVAFREATLEVDTQSLRLRGGASVDGTALNLDWRETFSPGRGEPRSRVDFSGRMTAAEMAARGAPAETLGLDGRARLSGRLTMVDDAAPWLSVEANLDGMAMALPALGWSKPRDAAGVLTASGELRENATQIDTMTLESAGLTAKGALRLGDGGAFERLSISRIQVGRTDAALELAPSGGGGLAIQLEGPSIDLAPLLEGGASSGAEGDFGPFSVKAAAGALHLMDTVALTDAELEARQGASGALSATVSGMLGRGQSRLSLTPEGDGSRFMGQTSNAGDALRALGFVQDAHGGELSIDGSLHPGGRAEGSVKIENVVIKNAPVLAEILSIGTVFGVLDKLATGGISFDKAEADFELTPDILRISEAAATGTSLGMSLQGVINRQTGALDLAGSVSPAFVLNGIFSDVPLIGNVLTGGEGQGILGFAYRVTGTQDQPKVSVNPLSALAPGPFRRIFTGTDDQRARDEAERRAAPAPKPRSERMDRR